MSGELKDELAEASDASGGKSVGVAPAVGKYQQQLSRGLSFKENVLITLSSVTPASSVFIIMPAVIAGLGGAAALAFAIAAVISIFVALCYAELSSAFPVTGGEYAFVARSVGKAWGFALFALSLMSGIGIICVIAAGAGQYLSVLTPALSGGWVGIVVIVLTTVVACVGIKTNAWLTGVFLVIEVLALVVLVVLGVVHVDQPVSRLWEATTIGSSGALGPVSAGIVLSFIPTALFSYNGYGAAVYYAEETKNARSTIGRAIFWSLGITVGAELVPLVFVILGTPSMTKLIGATSPMNYFLLARGGEVVNTLVSLGIAIAVINAVLAIVLQIARMLFSSARDRSWPDAVSRPLSVVSERFKTPVVATIVVGVVSALVLWLIPFDVLLISTSANLVVVYLLVGVAALLGRINHSTDAGEYRMKLWPAAPIIMIVATAVILVMSLVANWVPVVVTLAMLAAGLIYYTLYLRPRLSDRWTLPNPADEELV
jgi:amino acid transporter